MKAKVLGNGSDGPKRVASLLKAVSSSQRQCAWLNLFFMTV